MYLMMKFLHLKETKVYVHINFGHIVIITFCTSSYKIIHRLTLRLLRNLVRLVQILLTTYEATKMEIKTAV